MPHLPRPRRSRRGLLAPHPLQRPAARCATRTRSEALLRRWLPGRPGLAASAARRGRAEREPGPGRVAAGPGRRGGARAPRPRPRWRPPTPGRAWARARRGRRLALAPRGAPRPRRRVRRPLPRGAEARDPVPPRRALASPRARWPAPARPRAPGARAGRSASREAQPASSTGSPCRGAWRSASCCAGRASPCASGRACASRGPASSASPARLFRQLGEELWARGVLRRPEDVFDLTTAEVLGFVEGTTVTHDLQALVDLRRREYAAFAHAAPAGTPRPIGPPSLAASRAAPRAGSARRRTGREHGGDRALRGVGCVGGRRPRAAPASSTTPPGAARPRRGARGARRPTRAGCS